MARLKKNKKTMRDVAEEVERGQDFNPEPEEEIPSCPPLPEDITSVSLRSLGKHYGKYVNYMAYINERLAYYKVYKTHLKDKRKRRKALIILSTTGLKMARLAAAYQDSIFIDLTHELERVELTLSALYNIVWSVKGYLKAIDFEKTRRDLERRLDPYGKAD